MRKKFELVDYEPVTPSPGRRRFSSADADFEQVGPSRIESLVIKPQPKISKLGNTVAPKTDQTQAPTPTGSETWLRKRGHSLTFAGLFVFTFLVYFRPYELFPSLSWLSRSAFVVALVTLAVFIPTQLGLENRITARPREVTLVFLFLLTGLLSVPFALDPAKAFWSFVEFAKVVAIFIVMVNVVRTEKRLRSLLLLVLFTSCVLSLAALNDYAQGNLALEGKRIAGLLGGLFSNPNDLALHLVSMIPLSFVLFLSARGMISRLAYFACSLLLMAGLVATFSRGGFLGFVCVVAFLVWKLVRRYRMFFGVAALLVVVAFVAVAPSAYRSRLATTDDASAQARTNDLKRSILVAVRNPLFGVGMDNYILYSNFNKATHNAYTQVAAEMGFAAFLIYLGFLFTPFRRLQKLERSIWTRKGKPRLYYLSVGFQASLVGYMVVSFFASVAYQWYVYYLVAYALCLQRLAATDSPADSKLT